MQILFFSSARNQIHLTIIQLKSLRWIIEEECWKNGLQLHFFYKLQFQKPGCGCQSDSIHGVRPESNLGYFFMASGMLYVHISAKALKLLAVQRGFILDRILGGIRTSRWRPPATGVISKK